MATKKSGNAIVKNQKIDDMIAAGIEIKLTKMEIADYIAAKAKEEMQNRLAEIQEQLANYSNGKILFSQYLTPKQKKYIDMYNDIHNTDIDSNSATLMSIWNNDPVINFNSTDVLRHFIGNGVNIPLTEEQKELDVVKQISALNKEQNDLLYRINNCDKKSHRTLLVEQILSSSESGKRILADLQNMVQRAVKDN